MASLHELPVELFYDIYRYLCAVDYFHLSQTSARLRDFFHPLVYKKCHLYISNLDKIYSSINEWTIPSDVMYLPQRYSWFPNEVVKTIRISDTNDLSKIVNWFPLSKYPHIESLELGKHYPGNISILDSNPILLWDNVVTHRHDTFLLDLLPACKNGSLFHRNSSQPSFYSASRKAYYIFNCNSLDARANITNLILKLEIVFDFEVELAYSARLLNLSRFPNLERVKISADKDTPPDVLSDVICSLPKCQNLRTLHLIARFSFSEFYASLLDNLSGSWTEFILFITASVTPSTKFRLPTVTTLIANDKILSSRNLECGERLKNLIPFFFEPSKSFELPRVGKILENLTSLTLIQTFKTGIVDEKGQLNIFKNALPNLKVAKFGFPLLYVVDNMEACIVSAFKLMMKRSKFGDFDIYNSNHVEEILSAVDSKLLQKDMTLCDIEPSLAADSKLSALEYFKQYAKENTRLDVYNLFFRLLMVNFSGKYSFYLSANYDYERTDVSLLFLDILKYLPNLQVLELKQMSSLEEFFTFHHLIKNHEKLKKIFIERLYYPPSEIQYTDGEFYERFRKSVTTFKMNSTYGQSYASPITQPYNNCALIDMEMLRYNYHQIDDYIQLTEKTDNFLFKRNNTELVYHESTSSFHNELPYM